MSINITQPNKKGQKSTVSTHNLRQARAYVARATHTLAKPNLSPMKRRIALAKLAAAVAILSTFVGVIVAVFVSTQII